MPSVWCKKCGCIDDGYGNIGGICRSCIQEMKSFHAGEYDNVCIDCHAIIPSNWGKCCHCGGAKKYGNK